MVIGDAPDIRALGPQWLALRVDRPGEVAHLVATFLSVPHLKGLHLFPAHGVDLWKAFKEPYTRVKAAGGVVLDEQGRLLAIRRLGLWDLPKGKVDPGESLTEAALREVEEECGVRELVLGDHLQRTWHTYPRNGRQYLKSTDWYLMRTTSSQELVPQQEEGIEEVRWFTPQQADVLCAATYPSLLPVFAAWSGR